MTEQNSVSVDSSSQSPTSPINRDGTGAEDPSTHSSTKRLNQAVHIALTQRQPQPLDRKGEENGSEAITVVKGVDERGQVLDHCHDPSVVLADEWQRLERLKEDFLSTVSHELKTPLSSMYLSIQLLELLVLESGELLKSHPQTNTAQPHQNLHVLADSNDYPAIQEQISWLHQVQEKRTKIRQCLEALSNECKKEIGLVNNLLSLQESRAELPSPAPACIFLHDWLGDILTPFYRQFRRKRHQFHCDIPSSLSYIIADHIRLEKILQELITNAYKFTPDEGQIHLSVFEQEHILMVTVLNKGETIPCDEIPNLFNIFYRMPCSDPWKERGTGIGLALVKKWTEAIGGEIRVDTGAFGNAFTLCLPKTTPMKQVGA